MKCQACGAEVADDSTFCQKCGSPTNGGAAGGGASGAGSPTAAAGIRSAVDRAGKSYDVEDELWQGGFSAKAMIGTWLVCVLLTLALVIGGFLYSATGIVAIIVSTIICLLWIYAFGYYAYRRIGVHYKLTNQRFLHVKGILLRVTDRIEVIDIDDVTFRQGLVERLFGVGTIVLASSDRTHPHLTLPGVDEVQRIAGLIDDVRRKERRRRGIHIEQI